MRDATRGELHLSQAIWTLHGMLAPYAADGVAMEPEVLGALLHMLEAAAEEAAALEVLALHRVKPALAAADGGNVIDFPRDRAAVHIARGHIADQSDPSGGDAA